SATTASESYPAVYSCVLMATTSDHNCIRKSRGSGHGISSSEPSRRLGGPGRLLLHENREQQPGEGAPEHRTSATANDRHSWNVTATRIEPHDWSRAKSRN